MPDLTVRSRWGRVWAAVILAVVLASGAAPAGLKARTVFANDPFPRAHQAGQEGQGGDVPVYVSPELELVAGVLSLTSHQAKTGWPRSGGNRYYQALTSFLAPYRNHEAVRIAESIAGVGRLALRDPAEESGFLSFIEQWQDEFSAWAGRVEADT